MVCACPKGQYDNGVTCVKKAACACDVEGKMVPAGQEWKQKPCHTCTCKDGEIHCRKQCNITSCPTGYLVNHPLDDKCCFCESICPTTAPPKVITPTVPFPLAGQCGLSTRNGLYRKTINGKTCVSTESIEMTSCKGKCDSETSFADLLKTDCTCCKPDKTVTKEANLRCDDGSLVPTKYTVFQSCSCNKCSNVNAKQQLVKV